MNSPRFLLLCFSPLDAVADEAKELTCLWCGLRGCDYTVTLHGCAMGNHGSMQLIGAHGKCLDAHNRACARTNEVNRADMS